MKINIKKRNSNGFTLVELLVVIAIIGILAVVAVPALFKNIEKGKVAELEADISAIRSAVLSYYSEKSDYPYKNNTSGANEIREAFVLNYDGSDDPVDNQIRKEIEGLSFPFKGTYTIGGSLKTGTDETETKSLYNKVPKIPNTLYLTIAPDQKSKLSSSGIDKLKVDLGLENNEIIKDLEETGSITIPIMNK